MILKYSWNDHWRNNVIGITEILSIFYSISCVLFYRVFFFFLFANIVESYTMICIFSRLSRCSQKRKEKKTRWPEVSLGIISSRRKGQSKRLKDWYRLEFAFNFIREFRSRISILKITMDLKLDSCILKRKKNAFFFSLKME